MRYLGLLDLAGIQDTIDRESELKEIQKASRTIEGLTENKGGDGADGLFRRVINDCQANLVVAAGGNASFWADSEETVRNVFRGVSLELLKGSDGLEVVGAIWPFKQDTLASEYRKGLRELERRKLTQPRSTRFTFAGLEPFRPLPGRSALDHRLDENVPTQTGSTFIKPNEFDQVIARGFRLHPLPGASGLPYAVDPRTLGREEIEKIGLMAVVSMDGLGMGDRLNRWIGAMEEEKPSDEVFTEKFQAWSDSVRQRWKTAWHESCRELEAAFGPNRILRHEFRPELWLEPLARGEGTAPQRLRIHQPQEPLFAPFDRIYQGGDDLRFVCDARLALTFATSIMHHLEQAPIVGDIDSIFGSLTASAGIVFVDSHFPFSRASKLADDIRKDAKKQMLRAQPEASPPPSCFDWWLNRQGAMDEEQRMARGAARPLQSRNVRYEVDWDCLARYVLPNLWEMFTGRRNKLKDILAAAEEGPDSVRRLLSLRPIEGSRDLSPCTPPGYEPLTGFNPEGDKTFLRDAAELYDLHFPYGKLACKAKTWPEDAEEQTCSSH